MACNQSLNLTLNTPSPGCCREADRLWEEEEDDKHNLFNVRDLAEKDERMANLVKYTMVGAQV